MIVIYLKTKLFSSSFWWNKTHYVYSENKAEDISVSKLLIKNMKWSFDGITMSFNYLNEISNTFESIYQVNIFFILIKTYFCLQITSA